MLILHLFVAFLIALPLWYLGSWLLAQAIYRVETRNPKFTETRAWAAIETVSNFIVFLFSISLWLGLTYALQRLTP
ncbi:MAG: hypothetical protein IPF53_17065 [Blastocatellia bacterium]|jgi:hypothetical protein|nr:hypothetical protein [Blastocatellia bacterium]MBK6427026.1 hypothetical protein [Blastocatellia bacterium]